MKLKLLSLLLVFGSAFSQPIPFDPSSGLVEVPVTIDGRVKAKFGIDTGADQIYIDMSFARKNGLSLRPLSGRQLIGGIDGKSEACAVTLRSLRIGDQESLYNLSAVAVDFDALSQGDSDGPDGLIGYNALRWYYVSVDYPNSEFELLSFEPDFLIRKAYTEIPFSQYEHLILIDVVFNDDFTVPMVLDYCASYTTISPSLAERLDLSADVDSRHIIDQMTIGDDITSSDVKVVVKDHSKLKSALPRAKFEGIIGASFLYKYKITVDYKRKRIYVHD